MSTTTESPVPSTPAEGLYWHFANDDGTLRYDLEHVTVTPGLSLRIDGEPVLCKRGLHASKRALDALQYAPGCTVCRVTLGGTVLHDTDKSVGTERTVVAVADATRTLHEFAIWCAEQALALIPDDQRDPRSAEALRVKRAWLDGNATDEDLAAARAAAGAAALAAAGAAQNRRLEDMLSALFITEVSS